MNDSLCAQLAGSLVPLVHCSPHESFVAYVIIMWPLWHYKRFYCDQWCDHANVVVLTTIPNIQFNPTKIKYMIIFVYRPKVIDEVHLQTFHRSLVHTLPTNKLSVNIDTLYLSDSTLWGAENQRHDGDKCEFSGSTIIDLEFTITPNRLLPWFSIFCDPSPFDVVVFVSVLYYSGSTFLLTDLQMNEFLQQNVAANKSLDYNLLLTHSPQGPWSLSPACATVTRLLWEWFPLWSLSNCSIRGLAQTMNRIDESSPKHKILLPNALKIQGEICWITSRLCSSWI